MPFIYFAPGEPNNIEGGEDCLATRQTGDMVDAPCSMTSAATVCQLSEFSVCSTCSMSGTARRSHAETLVDGKLVVSFSCKDGYYSIGNDTITCDNGFYDNSPLACLRLCPSVLPQLENGEATSDHTPIIEDSRITYNCSDGYALVGPQDAKCSFHGKINRGPPECKKLCSVSTVENAITNTSDTGLDEGEAVTYTCNAGYTLIGYPTLTCTNGSFNVPHPQCSAQIGNCTAALDECKNGGTCVVVNGNTVSCCCTDGWQGIKCETPTDECSSNPCFVTATCNDEFLNYTCSCSAGYTGRNCDIDINECESNPCKQNETCVEYIDGFSCLSMKAVTDVNSILKGMVSSGITTGGIAMPPQPPDSNAPTHSSADSALLASQPPPEPAKPNVESLKASVKELQTYLVATVDKKTLRSMSNSQKELIMRCTYGMNECDWEARFHPTYGNCYTFNGNASTRKASERPGQQFGLRLTLNAWPELYAKTTDTVGFRMAVHQSGKTPFPGYNGFNVVPGYNSQFKLDYHYIKSLDGPYGDCVQKTDRILPFYYNDEYSITACQLSYLQQTTIKECGCANPKIGYPKHEYAVCEPPSQPCVDKLENNVTIHNPACAQECVLEDIDVSMSVTKQNTFKCSSGDQKCILRQSGIGEVSVFYTTLQRASMIEVPDITMGDALSSLGGLLGFYIGASVISCVEFIFILAALPCLITHAAKGTRNNDSKPSPATGFTAMP